jgi:DNA-binding LacI/PurR family transcriptional regulator
MHLLTLAEPPTAVLAASDEVALGVMGAAWRLGLRIPHDVSVIGIDDHPFGVAFDLTTIRQDVGAQARQAARILMEELTPPVSRDAGSAKRTVFPPHLVQRRSTAPPSR